MFDFENANENQKLAISNVEGPVLITADSGTEKTFTLVQRTLYMIQECGVKPEQIMMETFTEKAAKELITRITNELSASNIIVNVNDMYIGTFHSLFEVKAELKTEDKEFVLFREPKDADYYEFSVKDELIVNNQYKAFAPEQIAKSFHADTYCFNSAPEKECFMQYITNNKVKEVYFTGMFTAN